jgi:hypothetical protein
MQDLAESVIENLAPTKPAGYRLVVQTSVKGSATTIFEAKAVAYGGKLLYLARRPRAKLLALYPYKNVRDYVVPPKSDWDTLMATSPLQLKFIIRETLEPNAFSNASAMLFPPFVLSDDDRKFATHLPCEFNNYNIYEVGGGYGSDRNEQVLDEAIAALGILTGPVSGPFSWEK